MEAAQKLVLDRMSLPELREYAQERERSHLLGNIRDVQVGDLDFAHADPIHEYGKILFFPIKISLQVPPSTEEEKRHALNAVLNLVSTKGIDTGMADDPNVYVFFDPSDPTQIVCKVLTSPCYEMLKRQEKISPESRASLGNLEKKLRVADGTLPDEHGVYDVSSGSPKSSDELEAATVQETSLIVKTYLETVAANIRMDVNNLQQSTPNR